MKTITGLDCSQCKIVYTVYDPTGQELKYCPKCKVEINILTEANDILWKRMSYKLGLPVEALKSMHGMYLDEMAANKDNRFKSFEQWFTETVSQMLSENMASTVQ
jgi:hypothetical protein